MREKLRMRFTYLLQLYFYTSVNANFVVHFQSFDNNGNPLESISHNSEWDALDSDSTECIDKLPLCRKSLCRIFGELCAKTCETCLTGAEGEEERVGPLSWFDQFFGGFDNAQVIGGDSAFDSFFENPPLPVYTTVEAPRGKPKKTFKQKSCPPRSPQLDMYYIGDEINTGASGRTCQNWQATEPHDHNKTTVNFPNRGLGDHNLCRNPDDDPNGPWCYTTDPGLRWEYCDNSGVNCDECRFNNGDCGDLECWDDDDMTEGTVICEATTTTSEPTTTSEYAENHEARAAVSEGSCGKPSVHTSGTLRIVNGDTIAHGEHPWILALAYKNRVTCGGTVIAPSFAVSAAHCVGGKPSDNMVLAGVHDIQILTIKDPPAHLIERVNRREVKNYFTPEGYRPQRSDEHDISVLQLVKPLVLSRYIQPACLPTHKPTPDAWCEVSGWGRTKATRAGLSIAEILGGQANPLSGDSNIFGSDSIMQSVFGGFGGFGRRRREVNGDPVIHHKKGKNFLRKGDLFVVSNADCQKVYPGNMLTNNMFCAHSTTGVDTCQGDSGGPFVCKNQAGEWELSGVTSWGRGCSLDGYPGVYTNVAKYVEWIGNVQSGTVKPASRKHLSESSQKPAIEIVEIPSFSFFSSPFPMG